jgi:hypothetical protein
MRPEPINEASVIMVAYRITFPGDIEKGHLRWGMVIASFLASISHNPLPSELLIGRPIVDDCMTACRIIQASPFTFFRHFRFQIFLDSLEAKGVE